MKRSGASTACPETISVFPGVGESPKAVAVAVGGLSPKLLPCLASVGAPIGPSLKRPYTRTIGEMKGAQTRTMTWPDYFARAGLIFQYICSAMVFAPGAAFPAWPALAGLMLGVCSSRCLAVASIRLSNSFSNPKAFHQRGHASLFPTCLAADDESAIR